MTDAYEIHTVTENIFERMIVKLFMSTNVVAAEPSTPLPQIWKKFTTVRIHGLPVIDKDKKLLGIIAEEDILAKLFPDESELTELPLEREDEIEEKVAKLKKLTAQEIMSKKVYFTREDTNVMRALSRMIVRKVRMLPVLDDDDKIVGMISKGDIFRAVFKKR